MVKSLTIGILGGGQLGRMLSLAAARLGHQTRIFDPDPDAPAAQVAHAHTVADYEDTKALEDFASHCDVVTYEFENVPEAAVRLLEEIVTVRPNGIPLAVAQDRVLEKDFLNEIGVWTTAFRIVDSQSQLEEAVASLGGRAVIKTRRLGYDGKGQRLVNAEEINGGEFARVGGVPMIAERVVDFDYEASVIVARASDGSMTSFDPARNEHRNGILYQSTVPSGMPAATAAQAKEWAFRLCENLSFVGVLGLELFVLPEGRLLANEFAPRVHNSGHWTETACVVSQFEQHIRAVTGAPLGSGDRHSNAAMTNLIGNDIELVPELLADGSSMVNIYGKSEVRPGRKMGHWTVLSPLEEP